MELNSAALALSALGHGPRLEVFRLLVKTGAEGMAAGDIARAVGARPNTLSNNLNILQSAKLITSRRDGRSIIYSAAFSAISELLSYLVEDCCEGRPELCGDVITKVCGI